MKIAPIKFNIQFRGERDERQPLSPELKAVFADKTVPVQTQRLLWELSEVPGFYAASKNLSKDEFIKLHDLIKSQDTNILEMALKGDIRILKKSNSDNNEGESFFSFAPFVKQNRRLPSGEQKSIFDYIKEHPIFKIAKDAVEEYKKENIYPPIMPYHIEKDEKGYKTYIHEDMSEVLSNMVVNTLFKGSAFDDDDVLIVFDKDIKGKNDFKCKYVPVAPESVEAPYPVEPECVKELFYSRDITPEVIASLKELSANPYFYNLINSTPPHILAGIAQINAISKGMLAKMLDGKITMSVFEPRTQKEYQRPLIDTGKLLLDRKTGKFKHSDLYSILKENTIALETCVIYNSTKSLFPEEKIKYVILQKTDEGILQKTVTNDGRKNPLFIPGEHPAAKNIMEKLDKVPYKKLAINYNEN